MSTQIYRHLLRSVPHAVRHKKAATKNIRRVLRDDFEDALRTGMSEERLVEHAGSTLLFYLASSRSKEMPTKEHGLAHRVIYNTASLCYHHLSPHTQMQPFTKKRRVGGTDAANLRRRRSIKTTKIHTSPLDSFENDDEPGVSASAIASQVLPSLVVLPKPLRGPMRTGDVRPLASSRWDGQRPIPMIQTSPAFMAHLQQTVDATGKRIREAKERDGGDSAEVKRLTEQIRIEKGELKAATRKREKEQQRDATQFDAALLLQSLVKRAEDSSGAWLGGNRVSRWARGAWLPA